ncbi:MAG: anthranilate synthase component I family protein [Bacteroidota bacterium]|nr:anthranilate synthase component I family protein [Bacteroidota bacterium]
MQMLSWANRFNICAFLDNHHYYSSYNQIECLLAVGAANIYNTSQFSRTAFKKWLAQQNDWIFGHISYDFKNHIEPLSSTHTDGIGFPDLFLFQPETVINLTDTYITISCLHNKPEAVFNEIQQTHITTSQYQSSITLQARISKEEYLYAIRQLKEHILRGDCYEINYCQEFYQLNSGIDPIATYRRLSELSPAPFAAFYKINTMYALCASPERYLQKKGSTIISQPIKGTCKRNLYNSLQDEELKTALLQSEKERSENVMIVDLVRNDLSKICKEGSVRVEELFGIYSFPQVHQMISTIKGTLKENIDLVDILYATFPMGSMTGAPKRKVMELTELYERSKRGIYSGCIGYITPEKDFDFNVVIRSIFYNDNKKYLSSMVGSGITYNSDAEKEYEECLLKAKAMMKALS